MTTGKGGFLIYFEPERSVLFEERVRKNSHFSVELSQLDNSAKTRELFLVCFDGKGESISAAAMVSHKRGQRNTGARNYRFSDFVLFSPIDVEQMRNGLSSEAKEALIISNGGVARRIFPDVWGEVRRALASLRPAQAKSLEALWSKVCQPEQVETELQLQNLAFERDAIGLAFDCAGSGRIRRELLRKAAPVDPAAPEDSFIRYIKEAAPVQERELIEHDKAVFERMELPDFRVTGELSVGDGSRRLYVRTLDKGPLEPSIGVDLLIYLRELASLVMVQYKCCDKKRSHWTYRPDSKFDEQMESMRRVEAAFEELRLTKLQQKHSLSEQLRYSRLCTAPFYVKFCKRTVLERQDGELCDGRLLRRADLEKLLLTEHGRGPRDGRMVNYAEIPRYLSNSDFTGLVSGGWIGTSHLDDRDLTAAIRELTENSSRVVLAEVQKRR
ncbi:hypothetical protein LMG28727_03098 [Paraburkholderia kirstenboschensis]|uniref:hypothetical protein n=1 Tax=Paraburkholderia kirstenboschensis TaxID=1245436 RepID=UPI000A7A0818|nr:hypothetical protein [Paraburkholderia kirstenboschensis]CAD6533613.1 hypothetical protein LMG28727_03098 [Paraburkholderia kirstenboschensis]